MSVQVYSVRSASDAWKLLRGLVCVHKPSDYPIGTLVYNLKKNLVNDLNEMRRSIEFDSFSSLTNASSNDGDESKSVPSMDLDTYESNYEGLLPTDYAKHPLVIGKGFMIDDIDVRIVNPLSQRESGLCLLTVNDPATCYRLKSKKFPKTYRIQAEFGKRSDTMFTDGKILEKSTFSHLENRPQKFHSLLNSIQNSHQKEAFKYLKVSIQSQEAYELAVKGPVRPENLSDGLIYKLNCVNYSPPNFTIDATCVGASAEYLASLIHEMGFMLKTRAVTSTVRVIRVGYFDLSLALLYKHCNLENIIQNICQNETILQQHGSPHKEYFERHEDHNFRRPHFEDLSYNKYTNSNEVD